MDRLTKIKVFAECELHRASSEVCYTRDKYLLSLSAYDLAAYHAAKTRFEIERQILNDVLDIIQNCAD